MREPESEAPFAEKLELGFSFAKKFKDLAPPFRENSKQWKETALEVSAW